MDMERVCFDASLPRSCESSCLPDLDAGFLEHSLSMSIPSLELHQTQRTPHMPRSEIVVEYSEVGSSFLAPLGHSASLYSSSLTLPAQSPSAHNYTPKQGLTVQVETKSSTPREEEHLKNPVLASSLDLSCVDLTASHPSWEVSLIKHVPSSPRCDLESSLVDEPTWSSKGHSAFPSLAEISSLGSGTPPQANVSGEQHRPWREAILLGSSQTHTSVLGPYTDSSKDLSLGN